MQNDNGKRGVAIIDLVGDEEDIILTSQTNEEQDTTEQLTQQEILLYEDLQLIEIQHENTKP